MRMPLLALALLGGCGTCDSPESPSPAAEPPARVAPVEARMPEAPSAKTVGALWDAARGDLAVGPREEPAEVAWSVPCPLRYHLRWDRLLEVGSGRPRAGPRTFGELVVEPVRGGLSARLVRIRTDRWVDGSATVVRRFERDEAVTFGVEGGRWVSEEVSPLWLTDDAIPAVPSWVPTLPRGQHVGARVEWTFDRLDPAVALRLAQRRAKGRPIPNVPRQTETREATWTTWLDVEGEGAGILEGTFERRVDDRDASLDRSLEAWRGRWVILARGRLLHAALVAEAWRGAQAELGVERSKGATLSIEVRLVEACAGPTLGPMPELAQ